MSKASPGYYRERYHRIKGEILSRLGNRCACCGSMYKLVIDHVRGRNYESRLRSSHSRMKRYLDELNAGVPLRLLCKDCDPNQGYGCGKSGCTAYEEVVA